MTASPELVERSAHLRRVAGDIYPDLPPASALRQLLRLMYAADPLTAEAWAERQRRRSRRALVEARQIPPAVRAEVLASGPCAYCRSPWPTHVDHVVPVSRGGTRRRGNLAPACRECNLEKLNSTPDEWRLWRTTEGLPWPPSHPVEVIRSLMATAG